MGVINRLHPAAAGIYFVLVLLLTMFYTNPLFLLISLFCAVLFYLQIRKHKPIFKELGFYLLIFFAVAVSNPIFSHNGTTVLFFFNDNPVTLESILYGANFGVMLIAVLIWFKCFNIIMSSDKLMFLFGRFSPKAAMLLTNSLRLVPLFAERAEKIKCSQKALGLYQTDSVFDKLLSTARIYRSLFAVSAEDAIETGMSMKARGYELPGRSRYSVFKFTPLDFSVIIVSVLFFSALMFSGRILSFSFYPQVDFISFSPVYIISAVLFGLPAALEAKEAVWWKFCVSKI
jgi:energy-coupling factor transport system permease protein